MAPKKFCSGMYHNIRSVLDGTDEIRCAEGIVHNKRNAMSVGKGRQRVDIGDVAVGISQGFDVDRPCIFLDRSLHLVKIMDIHKRGRDPKAGKRMLHQVVAASIDCFLGHKVAAVLSQGLQGIRNGGSPRSQRQRCCASLQGGSPLFQHLLSGIGQTAVNISGIL